MNDLVEFLKARLDEDEQTARAASPSPWRDPAEQDELESLLFTREDAYHVYRWEPARVLAEVEAKRRMADLHSAEEGQHPDFCWHDKHELPCPTLRLLALPYADHVDYREEWRA